MPNCPKCDFDRNPEGAAHCFACQAGLETTSDVDVDAKDRASAVETSPTDIEVEEQGATASFAPATEQNAETASHPRDFCPAYDAEITSGLEAKYCQYCNGVFEPLPDHGVRLTEKIGDTPTGELWRGVDWARRRKALVKKVGGCVGDRVMGRHIAELRERLQSLASLPDNCSTPYDIQQNGDVVYLVATDPGGLPLNGETLKRFTGNALLRALGSVLLQVHAVGVIHGAVRPESWLVDPEGAGAYLIDFDVPLRKLRSYTSRQAPWPVVAPEIAAGGDQTVAGDIYGLCSTCERIAARHDLAWRSDFPARLHGGLRKQSEDRLSLRMLLADEKLIGSRARAEPGAITVAEEQVSVTGLDRPVLISSADESEHGIRIHLRTIGADSAVEVDASVVGDAPGAVLSSDRVQVAPGETSVIDVRCIRGECRGQVALSAPRATPRQLVVDFDLVGSEEEPPSGPDDAATPPRPAPDIPRDSLQNAGASEDRVSRPPDVEREKPFSPLDRPDQQAPAASAELESRGVEQPPHPVEMSPSDTGLDPSVETGPAQHVAEAGSEAQPDSVAYDRERSAEADRVTSETIEGREDAPSETPPITAQTAESESTESEAPPAATPSSEIPSAGMAAGEHSRCPDEPPATDEPRQHDVRRVSDSVDESEREPGRGVPQAASLDESGGDDVAAGCTQEEMAGAGSPSTESTAASEDPPVSSPLPESAVADDEKGHRDGEVDERGTREVDELPLWIVVVLAVAGIACLVGGLFLLLGQ